MAAVCFVQAALSRIKKHTEKLVCLDMCLFEMCGVAGGMGCEETLPAFFIVHSVYLQQCVPRLMQHLRLVLKFYPRYKRGIPEISVTALLSSQLKFYHFPFGLDRSADKCRKYDYS